MATASALNSGAAFRIEEDSVLWKALSGIPVIGLGISHIQQTSLTDQVYTAPNMPSLIKLIEVKNDYKIATIVGSVITTALIVAGVASGILAVGFLIAAAMPLISMGITIYQLHMNNQTINHLKIQGNFPPDFLVR